jgi:uncharacterized LabA/DUF88 family protein
MGEINMTGEHATFKPTMVFIDGSNFVSRLSERKDAPSEIKLATLIAEILNQIKAFRCELVRAYFYYSEPAGGFKAGDHNSQILHKLVKDAQETNQVEVVEIGRRKIVREKVTCKHCGKPFHLTSEVEKQLDLHIASDMLYFLSRGFCNLAVLVSGDEDFVPVVQQFKDLGGHIALAFLKSQGRGVAEDLLRQVDFRIDRENILAKSEDG